MELDDPVLPGGSPASAAVRPPAALTLDSPEWPALNARRFALIRKKNHEEGGLTPDEAAEFLRLQGLAEKLIAHLLPPPLFSPEELAYIYSKAGG